MDKLKIGILSLTLNIVFLILHIHFIPHKQNIFQKKFNLDYERNIFTQLNLYTNISEKYYNDDPVLKPNFNLTNMGLINDDNYCEVVDFQNIKNPQSRQLFITDYNIDGLARQLMEDVGDVVLPKNVSKDMPKSQWYSRLYDIPQNGNSIIITSTINTSSAKLNYITISQVTDRQRGKISTLKSKSILYQISEFEKKNKPHCYKSGKFFPKSYRLEVKDECTAFFNYINTDEYREIKKTEPYVFITKISWGSSRGNGVELMGDTREQRIRRKYMNGLLCGEIMDSLMAQTYISNPLTLDGHKFDFRIYMLIASTDPLTLYYHDGFLRVSLLKFDKNSTEKSVHFTNTALSKKIFDNPQQYLNNSNMNFTKEDLSSQQMWSMEKLADFLYEKKIVSDPNWLDNYLRPEFKKAFTQLVLMTKNDYLQQPNVFELFGLDFMLDDNLNLWFIECNASPVFQGTTTQKFIFQTNLLRDTWEIQNSYLQSRLQRLHHFTKRLQLMRKTQFTKSELKHLKRRVKTINRNYLEAEFQIREDNSFTKIIDYTLRGSKRFFNQFAKDCFIDI